MIAVIFELQPAKGQSDRYFEIAAGLRPVLDDIEGFLSVERFESLTQAGKFLSLSFFEDEAAVQRWRETDDHRAAQSCGRGGIFSSYRLRVARVERDYSLDDRRQAPADSRSFHDLSQVVGARGEMQ